MMKSASPRFCSSTSTARIQECHIAVGHLLCELTEEALADGDVGQKQRISIARVLLKDPPVIIFDEATSNIDTETEVKIREALEVLTRGRTTFIIAHRLSTLRNVDRIFVLDGGCLVEAGSHEALLAHSGVYRALYDAQFQL